MRLPPSPALWPPLPNAAQRRLLKLALGPAFDAMEFAGWSAATDLAALDEGTRRLLPFLHARLRKAGVEHPWLPALRRLHLHSLLTNRRLLLQGLRVAELLQRSGIPVLLLKGAALASSYYDDPGQRPMSDVDLMVPATTPPGEVARILTSAGAIRLRDRALHAHTYLDEQGTQFDIHWHLMPELASARLGNLLWERAEPLRIEDARSSSFRAEDHMFHLLVHGMRVSPVAPLRWTVDAAVIIRARPALDWGMIAATARQAQSAFPVSLGLSFLIEQGIAQGEAVAALAELRAAPEGRFDRYLFAGQMRRPSRLYSTLRPILLYFRLRRLRSEIPSAGFMRFLVLLWGLDKPRQIPGALLERLALKLTAKGAPSDG